MGAPVSSSPSQNIKIPAVCLRFSRRIVLPQRDPGALEGRLKGFGRKRFVGALSSKKTARHLQQAVRAN
jgi:hypothetical protein